MIISEVLLCDTEERKHRDDTLSSTRITYVLSPLPEVAVTAFDPHSTHY